MNPASHQTEVLSIMRLAPVIPVLTVRDAEDGVAQARALVAGRRCVAIFAAMRNKDVVSMAAGLRELTSEIVVTAPAVERATAPEELSGLFDPPAAIEPDVTSALDHARRLAGHDGVVVVCGSLYLAGEVLDLLGV